MCAPACSPQNYIQELRGCASKEQEKERVDKELGKIRKKYTSDKAMSGARWSMGSPGRAALCGIAPFTALPLSLPRTAYDKRKYMWKLLYTHMLGYNVDFGHKQAMDLIAAPAYAEKQVGYVACAVFLSEVRWGEVPDWCYLVCGQVWLGRSRVGMLSVFGNDQESRRGRPLRPHC